MVRIHKKSGEIEILIYTMQEINTSQMTIDYNFEEIIFTHVCGA